MRKNKDHLYFPRSALGERIFKTFEIGFLSAVTIFAPLRKGKTTFVIHDLIPMAKERGFLVATADLWLDRDHPEQVIAKALKEAIHGSGFVRRNWMRLSRPSPLVKGSGFELLELFERFRHLGKGRALLVIDEVPHLSSRNEFESFTATLRALLQRVQGDVFVVFTGSSQDGLARMFRNSKAPFYQFSSVVPFPDLDLELAQHLGNIYHEVTGRESDVTKAFELYVARGMMPMYLRELYKICVDQNLSAIDADKIVWSQMLIEGQLEIPIPVQSTY